MEPKKCSFTRDKAAFRLACHSPHWCYLSCVIACRFTVTALGPRRFGFFTKRQLSVICHCEQRSEVTDTLAWQCGERQPTVWKQPRLAKHGKKKHENASQTLWLHNWEYCLGALCIATWVALPSPLLTDVMWEELSVLAGT